MKITGAELFVKALKAEGVEVLFGYPGGQVIDLFDALYGQQEIKLILPRHEQGLIHAADGYARSTGKVGVCLVTSGPGAANLVTGIATAEYDSVPLVCFAGQVPTGLIGNHSFQEVDMVSITKSICKDAVAVKSRQELGAVIRRAFRTAAEGRPGVVVVEIPKDIQCAPGEEEYPDRLSDQTADPSSDQTADQLTDQERFRQDGMTPEQADELIRILKKAGRPLFLLGGGIHISHAGKVMRQLVDQTGIPAVTTIMGKGAIPDRHPFYVGNAGIHAGYAASQALRYCDVMVCIGTRFSDRITGKTSEFARNAVLVHIDVEPAWASHDVHADIQIRADAGQAVRMLLKRISEVGMSECRAEYAGWRAQIADWKQKYPLRTGKGSLSPQMILEKINVLFQDVIVAADVGQNQLWVTQFLELDENRQLLTSGGMGTMGYGLPAAIGAKIGNPDREVISICGDGGIQMNIQELATAVVQELPVIICIFNNGFLGNVRQWQQMFYHRHYAATCLRYRKSCRTDCSDPGKNCPVYIPDFVRLAESYGALGLRAARPEEVESVLRTARTNQKGPTVIEFLIEPEENVLPITPPGTPCTEMIRNWEEK